MGVNSPVENLDMFRQAGLGVSPLLAIGVGNKGFLSSAQDVYPHVESGMPWGGKSNNYAGHVNETEIFYIFLDYCFFKILMGLQGFIQGFMHKAIGVDESRGKLGYSHIHRPIYNYIFL